MAPGSRVVTVVLCDSTGTVLGALPAFEVSGPHWPEVDVVVDGLRDRFGLAATVLRLLTTDGGYAGGPVSYLAQLHDGSPPRLRSPDADEAAALASDPTGRAWWAEPDGLAWVPDFVDMALDGVGRSKVGALRQRKTWNLSVLLTAETLDSGGRPGRVWVKATPPFLADEAGVIGRVARVDPDLPPSVLGRDAARRTVVLDDLPGDDQFGLTDERLLETMARRWVRTQAALTTDTQRLAALGAVDLHTDALSSTIAALSARSELREALEPDERRALDRAVEALPARLDAADACGLPVTLVHHDAHPGNWRWDGTRLSLLDWGDVGVGSPALDLRAFLHGLPGNARSARALAAWAAEWRRSAPGSQPERAGALLAPVSHLVAAATYQRFLDHIEATERVYHRHDPAAQVRLALAAWEDPA